MVSLAIATASRLVGERDHAGHRAEDLLARRAVGVRDRAQHRRREPVAGAVGRRAADRDRGVVGHVGGDRLALAGRDQRAHLGRLVERVADPHRLDRLLERLQEAVDAPSARPGSASARSSPGRRCRTRPAAPRRPPRSRSASAKTTLADLPPSSSVTRLIVAGGARGDPAPDLGRAGEGDLGHVGVLDEPLPADAARARRRRSARPRAARPRARSAPARARSAASARPASARPCCRPPAPGATFHEAITSGKFQGTISPTTPSGSRKVMSTPPGDRDRLAEQPLRGAGVVAEGLAPPSPSRRARRRSACRRCAPPASPGPRRAPSSASARRCSSAARSAGATARQAGKAAFARATAASDLLDARRAAPRPSPARWPARRPRSLARPPPSARRLDQRPDHRGCARPPPGARARRARTRWPGARSPRPRRRSPTSRWPTRPSPSSVDPLVVVGLDRRAARRPAARAASEPGSRRTSWSPKAPGVWRCSLLPTTSGRCWTSVPPQRHVQDLHAAADAQHGHAALQRPARQRELEPIALGPGAARLRMRPAP